MRTLLVGMLLAAHDNRPAHLVRVHRALLGLTAADQRRLAVDVAWRTGPHTLTYRQVERTFGLLDNLLSQDPVEPGAPSDTLSRLTDALLEASIPDEHKHTTTSLGGRTGPTTNPGRSPPTPTGSPPTPTPPGGTAAATPSA